MDSLIVGILAKFVNNDTVAKYTRALVGAGFAALLAWKGAWLLPFLTPEVQTAVTTVIVGLVIGLWGQIAAKVSVPNATETAKVAGKMEEKGLITPQAAAVVKANPDILASKPAGEP